MSFSFPASQAANWATAGAISSVALLGAGAVLYVLGEPKATNAPRSRSTFLFDRGLPSFRHEF